ncbi:MAG: hypothetical protein MJZ30_11605 [Paludibacteraceae bacterium]|nr:hypothetical protein [Paludibacteraceae bacterium]
MSNSSFTQLVAISIELGCWSKYASPEHTIAMHLLDGIEKGECKVIRSVYRNGYSVTSSAIVPWREVIDEFFTSRKKCLRKVTEEMSSILTRETHPATTKYPEFIHYCITNNLI